MPLLREAFLGTHPTLKQVVFTHGFCGEKKLFSVSLAKFGIPFSLGYIRLPDDMTQMPTVLGTIRDEFLKCISVEEIKETLERLRHEFGTEID